MKSKSGEVRKAMLGQVWPEASAQVLTNLHLLHHLTWRSRLLLLNQGPILTLFKDNGTCDSNVLSWRERAAIDETQVPGPKYHFSDI